MARRLPELEVPNPGGSCWTCIANGEACDALLPWCTQCMQNGHECQGYHTRLQWPNHLPSISREGGRSQSSHVLEDTYLSPNGFSSLGLPSTENMLLQHFIKNVSRISLAVDHTENGYRKLTGQALDNSGLLNALLALSASHLSRWQQTKDTTSQIYLKKALQCLHSRLSTPALAQSEGTLVIMLVLVTYEVFMNSRRWKYHYDGITSWLKARGGGDLDPFLLNWLYMSATQVALHWGASSLNDNHIQLFLSLPPPEHVGKLVDPLYGCSVGLPGLMLKAARLSELARNRRQTHWVSENDIFLQAAALQKEIAATKINLDSTPALSMACQPSQELNATDTLNEAETLQCAGFAAEVFRHALHIFVFRTINSAMSPPSEEIKESLHHVFDLLPRIPDTLGPGSMLGWALVVIGAEIDVPEHREYIRGRCESISLLKLNSGDLGKQVLGEVWRRRDLMKSGQENNVECGWQSVMNDLGITIALF